MVSHSSPPLLYKIGQNGLLLFDLCIVAEAKFREITRGARVAMLANEDLQKIENTEQRRTENPYFGETNGGRTFTIEDNYPRLDDESEESYKNRLKKNFNKTLFI